MTDTKLQTNAIKDKIWLGGANLATDPQSVQVTQRRFEVFSPTSNLGVRVDRPLPLPGMPSVRNRREFALPWPDLRVPEQLQHLDILSSVSQPFGFVMWKQETDVFAGDATRQEFYLQRRQALPFVDPQVVLDEYKTRIVVYDRSYLEAGAVATELTVVAKAAADMDTGNPAAGEAWVENEGALILNNWTTRVRLGTAPPDADDCMVAIYVPMYMVLIQQEGPRQYPAKLVEQRVLRLVEFG